MRKILIAVLLAGAANPALAAPDRGSDQRDSARSERAERAPARAQRSQQRAQRSEPRQAQAAPGQAAPRQQERQAAPARAVRQQVRQAAPARAAQQQSRAQAAQRNALIQRQQQRQAAARAGSSVRPQARVQQQASQQGDSVRNWRSAVRQRADSPSAIQERNLRRAPTANRTGGRLVEQQRAVPRVIDRDRTRVSSRRPAPGARAPEPETARLAHARPAREWRSDWRRDRRYNWSDYRQRNRSAFRVGVYVDPFGWGYNRFNVGWRLWPSYYGRNNWLNDPWSYRLPPAYGPYRWVRYWDDALLVNIYTGQVVDAVHNFFW